MSSQLKALLYVHRDRKLSLRIHWRAGAVVLPRRR